MDGFELYELGRRLMQIGEDAIAEPTGLLRLPPGVLHVMTDVFEHPDTSITEIARRTGFPAGHVQTSVTTLSDLDAVIITVDPDTPERSLVRPIPHHGTAARIDERLAAAAGIQDPGQARAVVATLEKLARRLAGTLSPELFDWYTAETPPWDWLATITRARTPRTETMSALNPFDYLFSPEAELNNTVSYLRDCVNTHNTTKFPPPTDGPRAAGSFRHAIKRLRRQIARR